MMANVAPLQKSLLDWSDNKMKMIRALIIDDEENNCLNLKSMLERYCPDISVIAMGHSAIDGLELIEQHQPELVFLDIQMPGGTGFDLLEQLPNPSFKVIFVTAYDEYAIKALRISAIDYLLKPINILELKNAVEKAAAALSGNENEAINNFFSNKALESNERKIALPTAERILYVRIKDIIRFQADSNYTHVHLQDGQHIIVSKTLKEYEELLADTSFIRTHQSHMVNRFHVISYEKQDGGYLSMSDRSHISISRQRKDYVLKCLAE